MKTVREIFKAIGNQDWSLAPGAKIYDAL